MKLSIVILLIQIQAVVLESGHHEHSHGMETPHYKYSREANEKVIFLMLKSGCLFLTFNFNLDFDFHSKFLFKFSNNPFFFLV